MLEIIVLDKDFQELGSITSFSGIQWTRKTQGPGNYKMIILANYFDLVMSGEYLVIDGKDETGIVQVVDFDEMTKKVNLSGYFIEKKLDDRVITTTQNLYGKTEIVLRSLVTTFAITGDRAIPLLELGTNNNLGSTIRVQTRGPTLMEKAYSLANADNMSIKLKYDYEQKKLIFIPWKGKDRTQNQTENSFAIFSENEGNVLKASYYKNTTDYKNFAYIAGEGEGDARIVTTVDLREPGEALKELWVDAKDIRKETDMTDADYLAALQARGLEKLSEYRIIETISFDVNGNSNLIYKTDYDLGDKVTYQDDTLGVSVDLFITEVTEIYEKNQMQIVLTLGNENKTEIEKIKREVL
jgi:hypothetical protein